MRHFAVIRASTEQWAFKCLNNAIRSYINTFARNKEELLRFCIAQDNSNEIVKLKKKLLEEPNYGWFFSSRILFSKQKLAQIFSKILRL